MKRKITFLKKFIDITIEYYKLVNMGNINSLPILHFPKVRVGTTKLRFQTNSFPFIW